MSKLITCMMKRHKARSIVEELHRRGIFTANANTARGTSRTNPGGVEIDVVTVLVDNGQADEIFEYLYFAAGLDEPHHGIIYQEHLERATDYRIS